MKLFLSDLYFQYSLIFLKKSRQCLSLLLDVCLNFLSIKILISQVVFALYYNDIVYLALWREIMNSEPCAKHFGIKYYFFKNLYISFACLPTFPKNKLKVSVMKQLILSAHHLYGRILNSVRLID